MIQKYFFILLLLPLLLLLPSSHAFDLNDCTQSFQATTRGGNWQYDLQATGSSAICATILMPALPFFSIFAYSPSGTQFDLSFGAVLQSNTSALVPAFQNYANWPQLGQYSYADLLSPDWPSLSSSSSVSVFIPRPSSDVPRIIWYRSTYAVSISIFTFVIRTNSLRPVRIAFFAGPPYSSQRAFPAVSPVRNTFIQSASAATVARNACPFSGQSGVMVLPDWLETPQLTGTVNVTITYRSVAPDHVLPPALSPVPVVVSVTAYARTNPNIERAEPSSYRVAQGTPLMLQALVEPDGTTLQWDFQSVFQGLSGIPTYVAFDVVVAEVDQPCDLDSGQAYVQSWLSMGYDLSAVSQSSSTHSGSEDFRTLAIIFGVLSAVFLLVLILLVGVLIIRTTCSSRPHSYQLGHVQGESAYHPIPDGPANN